MVNRKLKFRKGVRESIGKARKEKLRTRRLTAGEPVQFPITNEKLNNFTRMKQKPKDCVINAFQILGLLDARSADIMRIAVGEEGLVESQIEETFDFVLKSRFKFVEDSDKEKLGLYVGKFLQPDNVVFIGVKYTDETRHVFLIGKYRDGRAVYIDPESPNSGCILNKEECYKSVFENVTSYYILVQN